MKTTDLEAAETEDETAFMLFNRTGRITGITVAVEIYGLAQFKLWFKKYQPAFNIFDVI